MSDTGVRVRSGLATDTIGSVLRDAAQRDPQSTALLAPKRPSLSYARLWRQVEGVVAWLNAPKKPAAIHAHAHVAGWHYAAPYGVYATRDGHLALSLSQLGTKYLNQIYYVAREVRDQATGTVKVPADYSELGTLLIVQMLIGLALPIAAIAFARLTRFKSA